MFEYGPGRSQNRGRGLPRSRLPHLRETVRWAACDTPRGNLAGTRQQGGVHDRSGVQGRLSLTEPWHIGLYSQTEAAHYSEIPLSTVHRWLARREVSLGDELVGFDEFVSMLFVRQLRDRRVRLKDILTAEDDLRKRTGHQHPFVHEALWVAGRDVLVQVGAATDTYMAANLRGQLAIPGVIEAKRVQLPKLVADVRGQLSYDQGRVAAWRPIERIAARPAVQFGLTCIEGTRLTTRAVFEAAEAGDDPITIARLFEVTESDVKQAIEWEQQLAA